MKYLRYGIIQAAVHRQKIDLIISEFTDSDRYFMNNSNKSGSSTLSMELHNHREVEQIVCTCNYYLILLPGVVYWEKVGNQIEGGILDPISS